MNTETKTTEQGKELWVLARAKSKGSYLAIHVDHTVLVNVASGSLDDVALAMQDPANVMNVLAYPAAVKAAKWGLSELLPLAIIEKENSDECHCIYCNGVWFRETEPVAHKDSCPLIAVAVAAVHPAEGDKT